MRQSTRQDMIKYLHMAWGDIIPGLLFFALFFVMGLHSARILDLLAFTAIGLLFNIEFIKRTIELNSSLKDCASSHSMDYVLSDFNNGIYLCNDDICLGNTFIFGNYASRITSYQELAQVYLFQRKKHGKVIRQQLRAKLKNHKTCVLCEFETLDVANDDILHVVSLILKANPHIQVGYK